MLQQTRVETVMRYYDRFLERFPNLAVLARARRDSILKQWEGLGYYRRALHLHEAAKLLARKRRSVPDRLEDLRQLPGIGEYTAAAIASIAFGVPAAAVDGNVIRVISRLFGLVDRRKPLGNRTAVAAIAQELIPKNRPGEFNQAWMDLGSVICTPRSPSCEVCPLKGICVTQGTTASTRLGGLPKPIRKSLPLMRFIVGLFQSGERWLVRQRPIGGLWSGLWEFPNVEVTSTDDPVQWARRLGRGHGLKIREPLKSLGQVRRDLSHRRVLFDVYWASADQIAPRGAEPAITGNWVTREGFSRLAVSTGHRQISRLAFAMRDIESRTPVKPPPPS